MNNLISINIVTHNELKYLPACIGSILSQTYRNTEIFLFDNASTDGTIEFIKKNYPQIKIIPNRENLGYTVGHNRAIKISRGDFFMPINPDVILEPNYIDKLLKAISMNDKFGMACGKLSRMSQEGKRTRIIDSVGMCFISNQRHFDIGSGEMDKGQYDKRAEVFGVSGATPLYRRTMLEDININGEYLDEDFFTFREDADLAWRAQLLGWRAVYAPEATGYHERTVTPDKRKMLNPLINMHSVKNRFLMRIKNMSFPNYLINIIPITYRDLQIIVYVLFFEHSSIQAFYRVISLLSKTIDKRKQIIKKKKVNNRYIRKWLRLKQIYL